MWLVELIIVFLIGLVGLYFKYVYRKLPDQMADKKLLHFIMPLTLLKYNVPLSIIDYFGYHSYLSPWILKQIRGRSVGAKPVVIPEIGIFNTSFDGVPVRVYTPAPQHRKHDGCVLFIHGGGFVGGCVVEYDYSLNFVAKTTGLHVVSIDYRLSPEAKFPIGLDDCERALVHYQNVAAKEMHLDPAKTFLMGDSAGGNLVAALAHLAKDNRQLPKIKGHILIYPVIQGADFNLPSYQYQRQTQIGLIRPEQMTFCTLAYLADLQHTNAILRQMDRNEHVSDKVRKHKHYKHLDVKYLPKEWLKDYVKTPVKIDQKLATQLEEKIVDPKYSPIFADDFSEHPPTAVLTCEYDILRDEGVLYAKRLLREGVVTEWLHYEQAWHGHFSIPSHTCKKMITDIAEFIEKQI